MQIDRRTFLLGTIAASACTKADGDSALHRAARFLWSQQAADGGFHSQIYGLLRSGQSLTPFVLGALLRVPETIVPAPGAGVDCAIGFIRTHTNEEGALGRLDGTAEDYPNFATALAVRAMVDPRVSAATTGIVARMVGHLRLQQFSGTSGWTPSDPTYGGWGMGGSAPSTRRRPCRSVDDALRTRGTPRLGRCRRRSCVDPRPHLPRHVPESGWRVSPVMPALNKASEADGRFASYGSATADGVLALRATGLPEADDRIVNGVRWLTRHHLFDRVPASTMTRRRGARSSASTMPRPSLAPFPARPCSCSPSQMMGAFAIRTLWSRKTIH